MQASARLKDTILATLKPHGQVDLGSHQVMTRNLAFLWRTMAASENLIRAALAELPERHMCGQTETMLRDYLIEHQVEEKGHARWLRADLESVGIDVESLPNIRAAVELVGTQYYLIHHVHPVCLLGYMALAECFPTPMETIEQLEQILPKTMLRTIRYHAEHDPAHGRALLEVIDALPERMQNMVIGNAAECARYFGQAIDWMKGGQ